MTNKWNPEVGDKAAVCYWSDVEPCTVIKRTEKFVWVQMDSYKIDPDWKPDMRVGGFVAHTVNNHDQKHIITRNEKGFIRRFGVRKDGWSFLLLINIFVYIKNYSHEIYASLLLNN